MKSAGKLISGSCMLIAVLWSGAALPDDTLEAALELISEGRYADARRVLDPLLERRPRGPRLRLAHGVLRMHEGRRDEAVEIFERLRRDHPDMPEAANNLAVLYAERGRLDDAREILIAALERRPTATLHANLGDVHMRLAQRAYDEARRLESGARADPTPDTGTRPPVADAKPAAVACLRAAGFEHAAAVAAAERWLQSRDVETAKVRTEQGERTKWYRVYVPPFSSREKAAVAVREMRGRGIRDVAIIGSGVLANGISVGVFRREDNMRRRLAWLEEMGYPVRARAEKEAVTTYSLEGRLDDRRRDALAAAWKAKFPRRPLRYVDCG